jgi:signal transduction histidine kinase
VGNAIKFTPEGGTVTVQVVLEDDGARIEVADTGIGLTPEQQAHVFDKFYQADTSATRLFGGAGLGLAIARALVQAHGGTIGVTSNAGRGSVFWFTLPRR